MRMRPIRTLWGLAIFLAVIGAPDLSAQGSDPAAIAAIKAQAARNDPDALFALAIILEVGREEPRNVPEAVRLLERAAALGHAPAKTQLGLMSQTGTGIPRDLAKANRLFTEAAAAGDAEGQFRLGMALAYGLGTTKDLLASRHWLAGAANQGHQEAQYVLGAMLLEGLGGEKNEFAARRWLRTSMEGPDGRLKNEARPVVEKLDARLLYRGVTPEELLTGILVGLTAAALLADFSGAESSARADPSNPLNPFNYDSFNTTKRRQNCRFVSTRTGMDITYGKKAFMYGSGNMWVCN